MQHSHKREYRSFGLLLVLNLDNQYIRSLVLFLTINTAILKVNDLETILNRNYIVKSDVSMEYAV